MTITAEAMRKYLNEVRRNRNEKLSNTQANLNVPGYWKAHVEPKLKMMSDHGYDCAIIPDISEAFADRLIPHGKMLGYSMVFGDECIHMAWQMRFSYED